MLLLFRPLTPFILAQRCLACLADKRLEKNGLKDVKKDAKGTLKGRLAVMLPSVLHSVHLLERFDLLPAMALLVNKHFLLKETLHGTTIANIILL